MIIFISYLFLDFPSFFSFLAFNSSLFIFLSPSIFGCLTVCGKHNIYSQITIQKSYERYSIVRFDALSSYFFAIFAGMEVNYLWKVLSISIPVVSALTWLLILTFSINDSIGKLERKVKKILAFHFFAVMMSWISLAFYTYLIQSAPYANTVLLLSYSLAIVVLYHFIYQLTVTSVNDRFPRWHYALPLAIGLCMQIWSFFVPAEAQIELFRKRGEIVLEYEAYSRFFLSKPYLILGFSFVYTCIGAIRLGRYYKKINAGSEHIHKSLRWVTLLISLSFAILIVVIIGYGMPRGSISDSPTVMCSYLIVIALHITMGYNVIRRNFLLYIPFRLIEEPQSNVPKARLIVGLVQVQTEEKKNAVKKRKETKAKKMPLIGRYDEVEREEQKPKRIYKRRTVPKVMPDGQVKQIRLAKRIFETYFRKHKPYLNPRLTLADLLDPLNTNRTMLSNFVNNTYGMNFNQYINYRRLKEFDELQTLVENADEPVNALIRKAGFATRQNYIRALKAQKEGGGLS